VANYIKASRAERAAIAAGTKKPEVGAADSRNTFAKQFDYDPAANDRPAFPGRGGPRGAAPPPPAAKKGG
jgi:hypothetical protein